jgi:5-methylcytosine-specific restriction enzyme A
MSRKSFSRRERGRLFALHGGRCYLCEGRIDVTEAWEIEHEIPWEISRDDSDDNLRLAHVKCHRTKTAKDRKDISKVQRMEAKHNGSWPKSKAKLQSRGFSSTRIWPASNNPEIRDAE